ncbi:MAG: hypothetical protein DRO88_05570 [Promethearchaeia archaeon]|nr:MAG: hypothetical protein DRO88_05570 [Candidatus Lokiarchaeia archaeon]
MNGQTVKKLAWVFFSIVLVGVIVGFVITAIDSSFFSQVLRNLDPNGNLSDVWMRINSFFSNFSFLEKETGGGGGTPG